MHTFSPDLPLKANYVEGCDIDFAAWEFAGHAHREEFRNSGNSIERTAWLRNERLQLLSDALAKGELLALGIIEDDPTLEIRPIPESIFLSPLSRLDWERSHVIGLGKTFLEVRICHAGLARPSETIIARKVGRPSHFRIAVEAWNALKIEFPGFVEWGKSAQNREIGEMAARLHPSQFPGQSRLGESTIRRHRRENPEAFN